MAVKMTSSGVCAPSAPALPPALDAAQWRLALQWLDRIDATGHRERGAAPA